MSTVELPVWRGRPDDAARAIAAVDAWAASAALAYVVEAFGGSTSGLTGDPLLAYLDGFSDHWDHRGGRERDLAQVADLSRGQEATVAASAPALGLADREVPRRSSYDTLIMTGGMIRAGIVKPRFARELIDSGVRVREVLFLGAFRPFSAAEQRLATVLGVGGDDETDAMMTGMNRSFGPLGEPVITGEGESSSAASWREWCWLSDGPSLRVIAAPSSDPRVRRANTADTYRFWAEHRRVAATRSVLLVTTPIYVPYQAAAAVEVLGVDRGLEVETVGVSATASDLGEHSQPFLPQHHLQELRSAIRAMHALRRRLTSTA